MTAMDACKTPELRQAAELIRKALMEHLAKVDNADRDEKTGGPISDGELAVEFSISLANAIQAVRFESRVGLKEFITKRGDRLKSAVAA